MKADGISNVATALRDRLAVALASSSVPGTVFVGPLNDAGASGAALILFLYRVIPSASLRNNEHRVPTGGTPPVVAYQNALPLDLYFLLTVGTTPGGGSEEPMLKALGFAMQSLQAVPDLTGATLGHETVHVSIEPLTTEEASRIWALFPTANYRTSVAYLATPVWIDPLAPAAASAPVAQDQLYSGGAVLEGAA